MRFSGFRELVETMAAERGGAAAFVHGDECVSVSWTEFAEMVHTRAAELQAEDARCEAILCDGSLACVIEIFAANLAGRAVAMLDESVSAELLPMLLAAVDADSVWSGGREQSGRAFVHRFPDEQMPCRFVQPQ